MALTKAALRREVRRRVEAMTREAREAGSLAVQGCLRDALPAGQVLAYMALPDELDLGDWLVDLAAEGRLVLPRVAGKGLALVPVRDLVRDTGIGAYGIREPLGGGTVDPEDLDAIVVPARAFDAQGHRLGRGAGYYDRVLPAAPQALRVGVAWSAQHVRALPVEAHDVPMDVVVDERGARVLRERAALRVRWA